MSSMFRQKQKAIVKLSDGTIFESGNLSVARAKAQAYCVRKDLQLEGQTEFYSYSGRHINYGTEYYGPAGDIAFFK